MDLFFVTRIMVEVMQGFANMDFANNDREEIETIVREIVEANYENYRIRLKLMLIF